MSIDTVVYFQVTDARAATYEIANYLGAVEQLTTTTLRNVVGGLNLEQALTSRDNINGQLRIVLDEATGKWGIRVGRVELKAIDPPLSIQDSMEQQMRAERNRRAAILTAEGTKQSQILEAEGCVSRPSSEPRARPRRRCFAPRVRPRPSRRSSTPSTPATPTPNSWRTSTSRRCRSWPTAQSNKLWIIPSELTEALKGIGSGFFAPRNPDAPGWTPLRPRGSPTWRRLPISPAPSISVRSPTSDFRRRRRPAMWAARPAVPRRAAAPPTSTPRRAARRRTGRRLPRRRPDLPCRHRRERGGSLRPAPRVLAHRGLATGAPENTMLAFATAVAAGADVRRDGRARDARRHRGRQPRSRPAAGRGAATGASSSWTLAEVRRSGSMPTSEVPTLARRSRRSPKPVSTSTSRPTRPSLRPSERSLRARADASRARDVVRRAAEATGRRGPARGRDVAPRRGASSPALLPRPVPVPGIRATAGVASIRGVPGGPGARAHAGPSGSSRRRVVERFAAVGVETHVWTVERPRRHAPPARPRGRTASSPTAPTSPSRSCSARTSPRRTLRDALSDGPLRAAQRL